MLDILIKKISSSDKRTKLASKNILITFLLKGWGGLLQFLLVPLTLGLMTQYEYGIWLTISNLLLWLDTMDIGLGNGLRNRLAESLASNDWTRCKKLISTTFCTLFLIVTPILLLLCYLVHISDCHAFLNVDPTKIPNLKAIITISIIIVGSSFIFKCIGNVYMALQLPAISNALVIAGQTLTFFLLLIISNISSLSMMSIVLIYTVSPLVIYILAFPITFLKYPKLQPSIKLYDIHCVKSLFGIGLEFFIAQIAGMFLFATSGIIISRILSPSDVTVYQIAYRYFGIVNILFTIISAPLWSATTDAYVLGDYAWIGKTIKKMQKILIIFFIITAIMFLLSNITYKIWISNKVDIPILISLLSAINVFIMVFSTCYSNMICGIGKIRLLMIISIINAVIYIPLADLLGNKYGLGGILATMILVNTISTISNYIQFRKLLNKTATGIWNK